MNRRIMQVVLPVDWLARILRTGTHQVHIAEGLPEDVEVERVDFDLVTGEYLATISSESFQEIPFGCPIPRREPILGSFHDEKPRCSICSNLSPKDPYWHCLGCGRHSEK